MANAVSKCSAETWPAEGKLSGDWVSLVTIVNRAGGIDASEPQRAWVLNELRAGRLRYRYYLDERKTFRYDDLPEHFWHLAKIHWLFSVAEWEPIFVNGIEVFLPHAGPQADSATAAVTPVAGSREQQLVLQVAAEEFPDGWQHVKTAVIIKRVGDKLTAKKQSVPKRDVFLRALGRRSK